MKSLFLSVCAASLLVVPISAKTVDVDGIAYNCNETNMQAEVLPATYWSKSCSGDITIPSKIESDGKTYTVTSIASSAFDSQNNMTSISLPESLITVSDRAFWGCSGMKELVFPNSVETIGERCFESATINHVTIGKSCKLIGSQAFFPINGLATLTVLAPVPPEIVYNTFVLTFYDTKLRIPAEYEQVYKADKNWSEFEQVELIQPEIALTGIKLDKETYSAETGTTLQLIATLQPEGATADINWTSSDTRVATVSSDGLVNLISTGTADITATAMTFSAACKITVTAPQSADDLKYKTDDTAGTALVTYDPEYAGDITIPAKAYINGKEYVVAGFDTGALLNNTKVTSITMESPLKVFSNNAFNGATAIREVSYPSMDEWLTIDFPEMSSNPLCNGATMSINGIPVSEIEWPEGITEIKPYTFCGLNGVKDIAIPASVTKIGNAAFSKAADLLTADLTKTEATLASAVFKDCTSLMAVGLPKNLTKISQALFSGCTALKNMHIPNSVTTIDAQAFLNCSSLATISLSESLTMISMQAFYGCTSLSRITTLAETAPSFFTYDIDPTTYGEAFSPSIFPTCNVVILTSNYLAYKRANGWENFKTWEYYKAASGGGMTFRYYVNNGIAIVEAADADESGNLSIPATVSISGKNYSVAGMDSQVFLFNDNLKSISIPNTMQAVGDFAFGGCRNLESIVCDATTPPTAQQYTFYGVQPEKCTLTVPETSKAAYREAIGWKDLMTDLDPVGVDCVDNAEVISVRYFTLQGMEVTDPERGTLLIKITTDKNGRNTASKIVF